MISVLAPSNRVGGLDLLVASLSAQTYKNFELLLGDNLEFRPLGRHTPTWMRHVQCHTDPLLKVNYCHTMNQLVAHARGDILLYVCDYSFLHSDCLATHAELQAKHHAPVLLDYDMSSPPEFACPKYAQELSPDNPGYIDELNATTDRYVADLRSGKLEPFMWSTFAKPLTFDDVRALPVEHKHRPCSIREPDDYNWCSFKNESYPTELVLSMNGHDEEYDKSHTYQDSEFSYRLRARGVPVVNGPPETGMLTIVNPRRWINVKRLAEPISANHERCFGSRRAELGLPVNPGFSLREWRERVLNA